MRFTVGVRMISHVKLALHVMSRYPFGLLGSLAYIFGNIEPDLCFTSYFFGIVPGDEGRGHSFTTALMRIARMENRIVSGGIVAAYTLGKITHYASDAFTYPHNTALFKGSLKEHMVYERALDRALLPYILSAAEVEALPVDSASSLVRKLHCRYERNSPSLENDLSHILSASLALRTSFSFAAFRRKALGGMWLPRL